MDYKVISVESRKGKVGKTTAALNLSYLLSKQGYSFLLLDIDITGTSISVSNSSSFWAGQINPIKWNKKKMG